mgnify:CR=1 FL=1
MKLVLDLGNSRCKWAFADSSIQSSAAIAYGDDFAHALEQAFSALARPAQVAAVCVADSAYLETVTEWVKRKWSLDLRRFSARPAQGGVTNTYEVPAQLGADRWAALIAARARTKGATCVVNCGTAITVDALDARGMFRGGVILPGLTLQRTSLLQHTHAIRAADGNASSCLALNTADAVAAGTAFGLAGAIDRILDEQAVTLGDIVPVLFTGGDAASLQKLLRHPTQLVPDLVLEGVARMADLEDAA